MGLDPLQTRHVMFFHPGRKLGGSARVKGDEPGPVSVRLEPCGVIIGRVVDDMGKPRGRLELHNIQGRNSGPFVGIFPTRCPVDQDGRFRVEVVPGLSYTALAVPTESNGRSAQLFENVKVGPGEVKDLGDLRFRPR